MSRITQIQGHRHHYQEQKSSQQNLSCQHASRIIPITQQQKEPINLPILHKKHSKSDPSELDLSRLTRKQYALQNQLPILQSQIIENVVQQPNTKLGKSMLELELRLHQQEMELYIRNKNRILDLLRSQLRKLQMEEKEKEVGNQRYLTEPVQQRVQVRIRKGKSRSDYTAPHGILEYDDLRVKTEEKNPQISNHFQKETQKHTSQRQKEMESRVLRRDSLKKMNKNNYLFEKRRMALKAKLSKGRQDINQFYQEAARKFQQYKSK